MPLQPTTILSIDPGTRELGFAVLNTKELLYYGVKTVVNRKKPSNVLAVINKFVQKMIDKYQPDVLAIEKMFVTQKNSALLNVVAAEIKALAKERGLEIYEYAPTLVRKSLCQSGSGRATKREVARILSERFPELSRYFRRTRARERDYYANLFDAIAVGIICDEMLKELNEKKQISNQALKTNHRQRLIKNFV